MARFFSSLGMISLLVLVLTIVDVHAAPFLTHREYAASFASWMAARNITYEASHFMTKFATYKANHIYVSHHNERFQAGLVKFELELNDHADLTVAEYQAKLGYKSRRSVDADPKLSTPPPGFDWICTDYGIDCGSSSSSSTGLPMPPMPSSSSSAAPQPPSPMPPSSSTGGPSPPSPITSSSATPQPPSPPSNGGKDWRNSGLLGPVKNQGQCGSCWSFASTASMQSAWALKSGKLLSFSEQQLVNCVNGGQDTCEQGGSFQDSWIYLIGPPVHRPELESTYPYTATSGNPCQYQASQATGATFTSSVNLPSGDENALVSASNTRPAIAVAIDASSQSFQLYKSGVMDIKSCCSDESCLDHAVTVVGYGTDASGEDFYLVQNSWGTTWGEAGYFRLKRNANNMCGIASDASYIIA